MCWLNLRQDGAKAAIADISSPDHCGVEARYTYLYDFGNLTKQGHPPCQKVAW